MAGQLYAAKQKALRHGAELLLHDKIKGFNINTYPVPLRSQMFILLSSLEFKAL